MFGDPQLHSNNGQAGTFPQARMQDSGQFESTRLSHRDPGTPRSLNDQNIHGLHP